MSKSAHDPDPFRRTELIKCDDRIRSIYPTRYASDRDSYHKLYPQNAMPGSAYAGTFPKEVCDALLELYLGIESAGGQLKLADGRRTPDKTHHKSWHHSGRAIDVDMDHLFFPGIEGRADNVKKFREIALPLGWNLISNEDWHFEFRGEWHATKERLNVELGDKQLSYRQTSMAALFDVGLTFEFYPENRVPIIMLQGQMHRVGLNAGPIDGIPGTKTKAALKKLGKTLEAFTSPDTMHQAFNSLFSMATNSHEDG